MRIQIFSRRRALLGGLQWYFRIRASNGQIIAQSEAYQRHIDARATAESLKRDLGNAQIEDAGRC